LRTRGSWSSFEREGGDPALGQFGNGFIAERVKHANQHGAGFDQGQFAVAGGDNLENQLCAESICSVANSCAGGFISTVDNAGINAGAALNSHFMALADQLLDGFRGCSNPRFTRMGFERNTNVHVISPA